MIDMSACRTGAEQMATNAKNGTLKIGKDTYTFTFDALTWTYSVTGPDVDLTYNTKSIAQARKWLREYLAN